MIQRILPLFFFSCFALFCFIFAGIWASLELAQDYYFSNTDWSHRQP